MRIKIGEDFSDRQLSEENFRHIPSIKYAKNIHFYTQKITNNSPVDIVSICIEAMNDRVFLSNTPTNIIIPYNTRELWKFDRSFEISKINNNPFYIFPEQDPANAVFLDTLQNEFGIYNYFSVVKTTEKHAITAILGGYQRKSQPEVETIKCQISNEINTFLMDILLGLKGVITEQIPAMRYSKLTRDTSYLHNLIYQEDNYQLPLLSKHELECLFWHKEGKNAQEISNITGYKISTIYSYTRDIRDKFQVGSTQEAAKLATQLGYID